MEIKLPIVSSFETKTYIERGGDWISTATQLAKIRAQIKELESQEKFLTLELKSLSEGACSKGGGFVWSCIVRKGSVDYSSVPQLRGVDLEQYRKVSWF